MDQERSWAARVAAEIGLRVHFYRGQRGLSAQDLADECAKLGMPSITRTVVTKLENERREAVTTAELQVLASALGVPPVLLLFPLGRAATVEVTPGMHVDPWAAIEWFTGNSSDPADPHAEPQLSTASPVVLWWQHYMFHGAVEASLESPETTEAVERTGRLVTALRGVRQAMRRDGLTPPPVTSPGVAILLGEGGDDGERRQAP